MSHIKSFEMEDIAYKEWSDHLDLVGSSRASPWLPAYGYHPPAPIQEIFNDPFSSEGSALLSPQQHFLYLETIVEETADDLCSESDRSGPHGWNSDSDADSVIHVPKMAATRDLRAEWRPAELDLDVLRKRRKRLYDKASLSDDDEPGSEWVDNSSLSSRSSSLIAFESLEKHCEDIFRTSASSDPFGAANDGEEDWASEEDSSDDTLHHSLSSHSSFRSSLTNDSRLRSYRSFDSLNLFDNSSPLHYAVAELSQSHSALDYEKEKEKEQEEFIVRDKKLTATTADLTVVTDSFEFLNTKKRISFRRGRDIASFHSKVRKEKQHSLHERKSHSAEGLKAKQGEADGGVHCGGGAQHGQSAALSEPCLAPGKPQHSVENLSEDSGFGDFSKPGPKSLAHLRSSVSSIPEDSSHSSASSSSSYYSDCSGSEEAIEGRDHRSTEIDSGVSNVRGSAEDDASVKYSASCDSQMEERAWQTKGEPVAFRKPASQDDLIAEKSSCYFSGKLSVFREYEDQSCEDPLDECGFPRQQMAGRLPVVSTPNLYQGDEDFVRSERISSVPSAASSLTHVPLKSLDGDDDDCWRGLSGASSTKGVHFCPVVSEVSWRDSYSEDDSDRQSSDPSTDEMSNRSLEDLCMENDDEEFHEAEEKSLPPRQPAVLHKLHRLHRLQLGPVPGPGSDPASGPARTPHSVATDVNINNPSSGSKPYVEKERFPPSRNVTPTRAGHVMPSGAAQPNEALTLSPLGPLSVDDARSTQDGLIGDHADDSPRDSAYSTGSAASMASISKSKQKGKLGGFFDRFSFRRLSGRLTSSGNAKKQKEKKGVSVGVTASDAPAPVEPDVRIIPLHGSDEDVAPRCVGAGKPPLPPQPPRVHGAARKRGASEGPQDGVGGGGGSAMPGASDGSATQIDRAGAGNVSRVPRHGLLETDLDAELEESAVRRPLGQSQTLLSNGAAAAGGKKARSLMDLGLGDMSLSCLTQQTAAGPTRLLQVASPTHSVAVDDRAKSMEFLLDKENQAAVQPPENELQKGGAGDRVLSEHQLRVQRSLQKLNIPDWYKNSAVAQTPQGFLLKRHESSGTGWQGLGSKTTSLSSLGSTQSASARSPTSHMLSPSPTPHFFTRWSTSRLNSGATSTSTSPCGSARSSFNYRQPYLGWRSQERLARPRTPHERLAQGLLPQQKHQLHIYHQNQAPPTPNLSEVRTSIKEVTSAIVHYVSGVQEKGSRDGLSRNYYAGASPSHSQADSGSTRGSAGRLCWLESSFVGSRPLDQPETPQPAAPAPPQLFLELSGKAQPHQPLRNENIPRSEVNEEQRFEKAFDLRSKPSPSSTTLDDVLESLLGLPPTSRSPSPGPPSQASQVSGVSLPMPDRPHGTRHSCGDIRADVQGSASDTGPDASLLSYKEGTMGRRKSDGGADGKAATGEGRGRRREPGEEDTPKRQDFVEPVVKCRYSKCGKTATVLEAKRTFKTCHNCAHVYCSRECRRAHWERHRRTCLHSRVGALCRQVLAAAKEDSQTLHQLSTLARRGYLTHGRGAVKSFFSSPELAERFVTRGVTDLGEPAYVRRTDLLPTEMGADLYAELMKLCKSYNPDSRFVLYVAVCVVSEVPTTGAVKWERQLVSRCCKVRLDKALVPPKHSASAPPLPPRRSSSENVNITRDMDNPDTLILTSLPGIQGQVPEQRVREISFTNIQRELRQRGVSLRRQFPDVYKKLCAYVEGTSERFTPVTIYPRDSASGKSFMCIIMPDTEPEKLQFVPKDSSRVQTVDVSIESDPA